MTLRKETSSPSTQPVEYPFLGENNGLWPKSLSLEGESSVGGAELGE